MSYHVIKFKRFYTLENKYVYGLYEYKDENPNFFIKLNTIENNIFLLKTGNHWISKEENLRYIVNIIYLSLGLILTYLSIKN